MILAETEHFVNPIDSPLDAALLDSYTVTHMPKLLVGLVGLQGCGKGTLADILVKQNGAGYFRFSAVMSDILNRLLIERNRDNFIKLSIGLRQTFGEDVFSYPLETAALNAPQDIVVIDGIRRPEDLVGLEAIPNFHLVAIEADAKLRFERMKMRGEKATEANMTWEKFLEDEQAETERTIPFAMTRATHRISNNGTREEFEAAAHELLQKLLKS